MTRKIQAKPIFTVKHDFIDALENTLGEAVKLLAAIDAILAMSGDFKGSEILREQADAFRKTLSSYD